jgi:biotin operon repressor
MIDRIRQDIQSRLEQLLSEADRLRQALSALGGDGAAKSTATPSSAAGSSSGTATKARSASPRTRSTASRTRSTASRTRTAAPRSGGRASTGGTKDSVLKALGEADGKALTASEVASATGLGRASVSTTLSKLARAGEVEKAERGYRLTKGGAPKASSNGAPAATEAAAAKS